MSSDSNDTAAGSPRLSLYQYDACPYCALVRMAIRELGLDIEIRDVLRHPRFRRELIAGGGSSQVPCLRLDYPDGRTRWMYESLDIIDYLRRRFG
ncbi:MAG: glutaredoxin [Xanthomonadaceae bacterium]|nr:glutaredoxin [Xanthomonadaceae bacterium]